MSYHKVMTTNPYVNALAAVAYVAIVAIGVNYSAQFTPTGPFVLVPIAMLSLLVLSVVVMATCFFYRPIQLFLEGEKAAATTLFIKTVATFALITAVILASLLVFSTSQQVQIETTVSPQASAPQEP